MADTSEDVQDNHLIEGNSQPSMHNTEPTNNPRYTRGHLSKDYNDYQVHQKIQIEKKTLRFLRKCKKFKRPPQSIRISGANVIEEQEKLVFFSKFESELLEHQIKQKEDKIKELKGEAANNQFVKLPRKDKKKYYRHFRKKLKFYEQQDDTKWQNWPPKINKPENKDQIKSKSKNLRSGKQNKHDKLNEMRQRR